MKRLVALATVAAFAFALASTLAATAASEDNHNPKATLHKAPPHSCTAQGFKPFSAKVWNRKLWERGKPSGRVIAAQRHRLHCAASPSHRKAMQRTWRQDKAAYFKHREKKMLWGSCSHSGPVGDCIHGAAVTYGASESWMRAVSYCESTWNRFAANPSGATGLFQFMPSTWASTPYGGRDIYSVKWQSLAGAWMYSNGRSGEWVCSG